MAFLPEGYFSEEIDSEDEGLSFSDDDFKRDKKKNVLDKTELLPGQNLINAILDRNLDVVLQLLEEKVNANFSDSSGWTPLMHASSLGSSALVDVLLKHGAWPNFHYQLTTPLMCLCDSTSFDEDELLKSFNLLIDSGANVNVCNANRMTPLMFATARGHMQLVARLVELGSDLEMTDNDGWTAIFYAVNSGDIHMVQMLKDVGCNLDLIDIKGRSLQSLASAKNFGVINEIVSDEKKTSDVIQQELFNHGKMKNDQLIMFDLPNYNESDFNGFVEDTIETIIALGMSNLVTLFKNKKIGYGQFLTYNEEDWKNIGVEMSFDRKKLTTYANRVIKQKWLQDAFMKKENSEFSITKLVQCLSSNVRIIHVLIATCYACEKEICRINIQDTKKIKLLLNECLKEMTFLNIQIKKMHNLLENLDKFQSADFIGGKII